MKRTDYISWDDYFMGISLLSGMRSKDPSTQVGACIVDNNNRIVSIGYNGFVNGCSDEDFPWEREGEFLKTKYPYVVHAEQNALIATSRERLIGATVYLACEEYGLNEEKSALWEEEIIDFHEDKNPVPCGICSRMLKNAGIVRVVNRSGDVCL